MVFPDKPLVLFDGVCNLCDNSVQFVIRHDPQAKFLFASLQSETGQSILKHFNLNLTDFNSFILLDKGEIYLKTSAILRGASLLGGWWNLMKIFFLVPTSIRDFFYSFVAKNRYRFFGKKEFCMLPSAELKSRFL